MHIGIDGRYIADHYPGIGRYTWNLIRALIPLADRDELYVFVHPDLANARYDIGSLARHGNVHTVPVARGALDVRQHRAVARLARSHALDLFHAPTYSLPLFMPCPVVVTLHDLIPLAYPQALRGGSARVGYRLLVRLALAQAAAVVVDSEATRRDLTTLCGYHRDVAVIPLAADPAFRPATDGDVHAVLARLGVSRPYVLYVGTNKPHKNLLALLGAWVALSAGERRGHTLLWVGQQDPRREAEVRFVAEHASEGLRWMGPVAEANMAPLYTGATCVVVPSLYEGFGLPVLEAMACETPVLTSNCSALPEVAGDAALSFDARSASSVRAALVRMLSDCDLRRELVARGRARAQGFSWARTAAATYEVHRGVHTAGGGPE